MLLNGSQLIDMPIMGLRTGHELAKTAKSIIDPNNLRVLAYEVQGRTLDQNPSLLRIADIREISDIGMIVDSSDEFVAPEDVIKINEIYKLHFELVGYKVTDEKNKRLGKVTDYTIDVNGFIVKQLVVQRPIFRSLNDTELIIHRNQITAINDEAIIVHTGSNKNTQPLRQPLREYANPFRQSPQADSSIDIT